MNGFRFLAALSAACLVLALPAAAPAQDPHPAPPPPQPLKPGQSAGIQAAQQTHTGLALIGSGAVIALVLVAATASNNGGSNGAVNPQFAPATTAP
jgi:hypothetical protein